MGLLTREKFVSKYIMFSFKLLHFYRALERELAYIFSFLHFLCYVILLFSKKKPDTCAMGSRITLLEQGGCTK